MTITCLGILGLSACSGQEKNSKTEKKILQESKEYTSPFICIRHCEGSGLHKPGNCPGCGLDYIENPKSTNGGMHDHNNTNSENRPSHNHSKQDHNEHDHQGHDH